MSIKTKVELIRQLQERGFSYEESQVLRRIQMTFHRWDEAECGDSNNYNSWAIERDGKTGKPFHCVYPHQGKAYRIAIPDREAGAQRRLDKIMAQHPDFVAYHQSDCLGCALYIVRKSDLKGSHINSVYTRGLAVCD